MAKTIERSYHLVDILLVDIRSYHLVDILLSGSVFIMMKSLQYNAKGISFKIIHLSAINSIFQY